MLFLLEEGPRRLEPSGTPNDQLSPRAPAPVSLGERCFGSQSRDTSRCLLGFQSFALTPPGSPSRSTWKSPQMAEPGCLQDPHKSLGDLAEDQDSIFKDAGRKKLSWGMNKVKNDHQS